MQVVPEKHCWQGRPERNLAPLRLEAHLYGVSSPTPAIGVAGGILWGGVQMIVGCQCSKRTSSPLGR